MDKKSVFKKREKENNHERKERKNILQERIGYFSFIHERKKARFL